MALDLAVFVFPNKYLILPVTLALMDSLTHANTWHSTQPITQLPRAFSNPSQLLQLPAHVTLHILPLSTKLGFPFEVQLPLPLSLL